MKEQSLRFGFDVVVDAGSFLRPNAIEFWSQETKFEKNPTSPPFKYMADALVGLSAIKLNHYLRSPLLLRGVPFAFCDDAWKTLDPHFELFQRSYTRVQALKPAIQTQQKLILENFEKSFSEVLEMSAKPWGYDLHELFHLIDSINFVEEKLQSPLLYNFSVQFSKPTLEKLHLLYSLLFHLRAVIALDHNAHCEDTTFEGVKCDAITDYIPKAEYVSNDAQLYYHFKKLTHSFTSHRDKDTRIDRLLTKPTMNLFQQFSHNAYCLIENLPNHFLAQFNHSEMEEALHLIQMDWLLAAPAGILFKIREELYGLQNGYEKIFWTDVVPTSYKHESKLSLSLELKEADIFKNLKSA